MSTVNRVAPVTSYGAAFVLGLLFAIFLSWSVEDFYWFPALSTGPLLALFAAMVLGENHSRAIKLKYGWVTGIAWYLGVLVALLLR